MICLIRILASAVPSSSSAKVWLRGDQIVSIGRQEGADLCVADPHMSRRHFLVEGAGSGFRLRDLDSRNGTRLNGVKVTAAILHTGDLIQAGATTLGVEFRDYDSETPDQGSASQVDPAAGEQVTRILKPDPQQQQCVAPDVTREPGVPKLSDEETQWVIDDATTSVLSAVNPAIAALGVYHVASDNTCTETELLAPLNRVRRRELQVTSDLLANVAEQQFSHRDDSQGNQELQPVLAYTETAKARQASNPAEPVSASVGDMPLPEGLEGFKLQKLPEFKTGRGMVLRNAGARAIDLCEHLGQFYRLILVVNRSQLDPTCANLLDYLVEQGAATAVTQTLYRIDGDTASVPLLQLMRRASRRDAAVCIGFRYTDIDPPSIIAEMSHLVCYPSLLYSQLTRLEKNEHHPLLKKVVFFLFEKDLTGDLYLFAEYGFRPTGTKVK